MMFALFRKKISTINQLCLVKSKTPLQSREYHRICQIYTAFQVYEHRRKCQDMVGFRIRNLIGKFIKTENGNGNVSISQHDQRTENSRKPSICFQHSENNSHA